MLEEAYASVFAGIQRAVRSWDMIQGSSSHACSVFILPLQTCLATTLR